MNYKTLLEKANSEIPASNWERDLFDFVKRWDGPEDFIEVRTSGSTGLPKLIRHKKEAMLQSAKMTCDFLGLKRGMRALICLSATNIAGMMMVVRAFERELDILAVPPDGHPLRYLDSPVQIDFCAMVPAQVYNSLQTEEERIRLNNLETIIIGGAPVSHVLQQEIRILKGNVWLTFGMTETMSHIALRKLNGRDASEEFKILEGIRIDVKENSNTGHLIVRAPYLSDEFIVTNDLVELTGPGTFKWLGRGDHVINSGGKKIFPEAVESKIAPVIDNIFKSSMVRYFITPVPHERLGEVPVLVIELPEPSSQDSEMHMMLLQRELSAILPRHEIPRDILYAEKFIETPTGKIIRSATVKRLQADK